MSASGRLVAEGADEVVDPALQEVVAEVHDERRGAEERLGGQNRVREPARRVLDDIGDPNAEAPTRRRPPRGSRRRSPAR